MITSNNRIYWDLLVFLVIIVTAFEIPYGLLVGYDSRTIELAFDLVFAAIFGIDILLNCFTVHEEHFGGFFGWRVPAGLFFPRLSPRAKQHEAGRVRRVFTRQPAVAQSYLASGWFLIDLLATIPWVFLAQNYALLGLSRMLRFLRIVRLIRLIRDTKKFMSVESLGRVTRAFPSMGRLLLTLLLIPWIGHVMACVLVWAEHTNPASDVGTYGQAVYGVYLMFMTGSPAAESLTDAGQVIVVMGVILSLAFIGSLLANLTAFFAGVDSKRTTRGIELKPGHTLILGWNPAIFAVLRQVSTTDEGVGGHVVVVADLRLRDMQDRIAANCPELRKRPLHIQCGDYTSATLLEKLSIHEARQVILLGETESISGGAHSLADVRILKGILACCQAIESGRKEVARSLYGEDDAEHKEVIGQTIPIVAAVGSKNAATALSMGIPDGLKTHVSIEVVGTVSMTCLLLTQIVSQPALAGVYFDLLSYEVEGEAEGAEVYCVPVNPAQADRCFDDLVPGYQRAIPIGFISDGETVLNPALGSANAMRPLTLKDTIVLIASARDDMEWDESASAEQLTLRQDPPASRPPRSILVLGTGLIARSLVNHLQAFLPAGSAISTWAKVPSTEVGGCKITRLDDSEISFEDDESVLVRLITDGIGDGISDFDTVVLVPSADDPAIHDAEILMGLTALKARCGDDVGRVRVVVDLLDARNQKLTKLFGDPVAVVSNQLVSNYLVQLSHDPQRGEVYRDLMDGSEGAEVYARSAVDYLEAGEVSINFSQLAQRARQRREIAIGYIADSGLTLAPADRKAALPSETLSNVIVIADE